MAEHMYQRYLQRKKREVALYKKTHCRRCSGLEFFLDLAQEKFDAAVTFESDATETPLTLMVPPDALVTRTSTVLVPNPLEFSKKL